MSSSGRLPDEAASQHPLDPSASFLAGEAFRSMVAKYATVVIGTGISVLLARVLEADGRGAYAYVVALASSVAWASHLSVETGLVLSWSSRDRHENLVGASIAIAVLVGGAAALLASGWLVVGEPESPQGVETWMLAVALATTPGVLLSLYMNAVLANEGRIPDLNRVALAAAGAQLVALIGLISLGNLDVGSAVVLWAIGMTTPSVILFWIVARTTGIARPSLRGTWHLLAVGLKFHIGVLAFALILRVDVLLLAGRVDVAQLGIYSIAVALVELTLVATSALSQVALQVQVLGKPEDHREFAALVTRANWVLAAFVLIGLLALGPWGIAFVFGDSYRGTFGSVLLLAPGVLALASSRPLGVYLARLERPFLMSAGMAAGLAANIVLNLVLIPSLGIEGAALASSFVYIGIFVWLAIWFSRTTGLGPRHLTPGIRDVEQMWHGFRTQISDSR